jgi:hypothetical protein
MFKNLLLICFIFTSALILNAQALTITPSDSVSVSQTVTSMNDEVVLYAYVKNDSSVDLTFKWRVVSSNSPAGWDISYCDNTDCLDLAFNNQNTFLLKADSTSILKMAYLPFLTSGESDIEISVSIDGMPSSSVSVNYKAIIAVGTVGIKTIDSKALSLFPNPATNFIQIKGIENIRNVNSIEVYSIIGKKIMTSSVSTMADLELNIQNLENGVYLVKLFDNKQSVFYTKTFVKK